ncbi:hypothetical protein JOM56_006931 [Amanita muscaria]
MFDRRCRIYHVYRMNNGPGGMSDAAKRRVDHATAELTGTRCLIENTSSLITRRIYACSEDRLQSVWNMERHTLNVDTRYNILLFQLMSKQDNVYKYTLIAHPDMENIPIHRQADPSLVQPSKLKAADFTYYAIPIITSLLSIRTGSKLTDLPTWTRDYGPPARDDMMKVQAIWTAWKLESSLSPPVLTAGLKADWQSTLPSDVEPSITQGQRRLVMYFLRHYLTDRDTRPLPLWFEHWFCSQ